MKLLGRAAELHFLFGLRVEFVFVGGWAKGDPEEERIIRGDSEVCIKI